MADLKTKIGAYDRATRTVPVTFTSGAIVHDRRVNAVLNDDGRYDQAATQARVAQVALGVAHKIAVGAIAAQPATPDEDA
ncbi:hypothetical protein [Novosphingobium pituita]|uniref:Uncharacterized protein n=1 Tax=Novosphingobium pituita TaxID=3056842 RepID=A0ABQ6P679_9SPHN|nr:hypothetical protein [Novosphingobium sp. IK01]GMM59909.1 hypothetical protein NUTIK01_06860 [Novosphingobium sp. IK01]